jgi:glycine dehydrogenase
MFIAMMGPDGLWKRQSGHLNANYIAARLSPFFTVLYKGRNGRVAHECILDVREWKQRAGIEVEDIAKRLMDYGFHAPTMSWPVPGTLMIEPTESESRAELDRFCDAMIAIHGELCAVERGELSRSDNPLKNAPHTAASVTSDAWAHAYGRELAAYPVLAEKVLARGSAYRQRWGSERFCSCLQLRDNHFGPEIVVPLTF